jgi:hypothetical protein
MYSKMNAPGTNAELRTDKMTWIIEPGIPKLNQRLDQSLEVTVLLAVFYHFSEVRTDDVLLGRGSLTYYVVHERFEDVGVLVVSSKRRGECA